MRRECFIGTDGSGEYALATAEAITCPDMRAALADAKREETPVAIAAQPVYTDDQVVHLKVSWSAYEALVESLGDDSNVRLTYDGEILEIMSPGSRHDFLAHLLGDMLASVRLEWRIELTSFGSTTFRAEKTTRGFEGDQSYYVGELKMRIRDVWNVDIAIDPPPDLVIEIDITNSSADKFATFAKLGVPEVWHFTPRAFVWYALEGGAYTPIVTSRMIAGLPQAEVEKRIANAQPGDTLAFLVEWQQWLQKNRNLHKN